MIIRRQYEWLGVLYESDPGSRAVVDEAFSLAGVSDEKKASLLEYNHSNIVAFMNIGCGIPGKCYNYIKEGLAKLDAEAPYDNHLSFLDVSGIEYETSRKGRAIQMRFVIKRADCPYRIVGFAAIKDTGDKVEMDKGWNMIAPFTIG